MQHEQRTEISAGTIDLALAIEPDLRLIEGLATVLRHLGEGADPIEPNAIAALASCVHGPIARMTALQKATARNSRVAGATTILSGDN